MQDNTLLTIALGGSIVGLIALFFIAQTIQPHEIIVNLDQHERDETLKTQGKIVDITHKGDVMLVKLKTNLDIPVVLFEDQNLEKGSEVEIIGTVSDYKGKRELIAQSIKKI